MKSFFYILSFFISVASLNAQQFNLNTTRFVGSDTTCNATTNCAIGTYDGGIAFAGTTNCFNGGGDIPVNFIDTLGSPHVNLLVGKVDSNMNVVWVRFFGGSDYDGAWGMVQTPDGGYAVLGSTYSHDRDVTGIHGTVTGDLWLIRLDANGHMLWQKCYGSNYDEQAVSIALAPDNGFIMLGVSNGMGYDVPAHYSGSQFDYDWFVVKTDDAGSIQWTKTIGGIGDESFHGKMLVADEGYYLVGSSLSTDHDCTDTAWHAGVTTYDDVYIFKLDPAGDILWRKSYGGSGGDQIYDAIWDSRDECILAIGLTRSNDYMISGYHGGQDMLVVKTDKNGILKWAKCYGSNRYEQGAALSILPLGYVVSGLTFPGMYGEYDNWMFDIDTMGTIETDKQFGGSTTDYPSAAMQFKHGIAIVGSTTSDSFTEGVNVGHGPILTGDTYISYLNFWPLAASEMVAPAQKLAAYPNPCSGHVQITISNNAGGNLTITNYMGINIFEQREQSGQDYIDINTKEWAKGLYIVRWSGDDGILNTTKLMNK